jgi:hypothetical protein
MTSTDVHNAPLVSIVIKVMTWSPRQHTNSILADDVRIYSSNSQPDGTTLSQPRGTKMAASLLFCCLYIKNLKILKSKCYIKN